MENIVIIDDEKVIQETLLVSLKDNGWNIHTAANGKDGLELIAQTQAQLAIIDYKLPDIDGISLLKKARETSKDIEVILLTGVGGVDTAISALRAGAYDYLQKPMDIDEIRIIIQRALEKISLARQSKSHTDELDTKVFELQEMVKLRDQEIKIRLQTEEKLRRNREDYRLLLENVPDVIFTLDADGIFTTINNYGLEIMGYHHFELIDHHFLQVVHPDDLDEVGFIFKKAFQENIVPPRDFRFRIVNKDWNIIWISLNTSITHDKQNKITQLLGVARDITMQKRLADEFQLARDEAEKANQAKSGFLTQMSHELRSPTSTIIDMADLLRETSLTGEQQRYITNFQSAAENLLAIINDFLDLSKIDTEKLELEQIDFDLNELIEQIIDIMAIKIDNQNIELTHHIAPSVPGWLRGDPARLRQVLVNLIDNAIKFTEEGSISLEVQIHNLEQEKELSSGPQVSEEEKSAGKMMISLSVQDTGIGIAAKNIDKIFTPFTQEKSSVSRKYGGTGLGLNICQQLVKLMGGKIWVESHLNQGTKFIFTVQMENSLQKEKITSAEIKPLAGKKALVVGRNSNIRRQLKEMLTQWGLLVSEKERLFSCPQKIKMAKQKGDPFDFLIADVRSMGRDAFKICQDLELKTILIFPLRHRKDDLTKASNHELPYLIKPLRQEPLRRALLGDSSGQKEGNALSEMVKTKKLAPLPLKTLKILLIEDSEDNRNLLKTFLKKTPHQVEMAINGKQGVEKFQADRFDLVLMDIQMPLMDGYEATKKIRKLESQQKHEPTPIIALTAHALKEMVDKSLRVGCSAHLTKPLKKKQFLSVIAEYARTNS